MIDISLHIRKLSVVQAYIFAKIDGKCSWDLDKMLYELQVEYDLKAINKTKLLNEVSSVIITDHGYVRAKERLSMNRTSFKRLAEIGFINGVKHKDTKGNLRRYIDGIWFAHRNADNVRIYGENIFLFRDNVLITVYQVPNNLRKNALKLQS